MLEPKVERVVGQVGVEVVLSDARESQIKVIDLLTRLGDFDNRTSGSRRRSLDYGRRIQAVLQNIAELVLLAHQIEKAGLREKATMGLVH